jgi:hypothetical protein
MRFSKEELTSDYWAFCELYEHLANLHGKTKILGDEIINNGIESIKLVDLRLSEIYSLYNTANLYLSIKGDLHHYEITSLLSFWNETYIGMYLVAREDLQNTSYMSDKFQNYLAQYDIVEHMLKSKIQELKKLL